MKQNISLVRAGFCQSCKRKLDYDLLKEGVRLRFCSKCKASEYFHKNHFRKIDEKLFMKMNGELWGLKLSEEWGFATKDDAIIELGIGARDIVNCIKTSRVVFLDDSFK